MQSPRGLSHGSARRLGSEAGFALVEVMVSAVLLVVLALGTLPLIEQSSKSSSQNRQRSVATSLATADQDAMRQSPASTLANYHTSGTKLVNGITYTIKSDVDWIRDAGGLVTCSSNTTRSEYAKITSKVTWTTMGSMKPIIVESYVTPGIAALQRGAVAVKLAGDDGTGAAGIPVTDTMPASGSQTGTTDGGGCVVMANIEPGANTITYNVAGYVDNNGTQSISKPISVASGATSQINGAYDQSSSATATFVDTAGTSSTQTRWPSVSFYNTGITNPTNATRTFIGASGTATPVASVTPTGLYPFVTSYGVYAGKCGGNNPTTYLSTATLPSVTVPRATTANAVSPVLPNFKIIATTGTLGTGTAVSGLRVSVAPASVTPMSGCNEDLTRAQTFAMGDTTDTSGAVTLNLPYGIWNVCLDNNAGTKLAANVQVNDTPAGTTGTYAQSLTTAPATLGKNIQFKTGTGSTTTSGTCP